MVNFVGIQFNLWDYVWCVYDQEHEFEEYIRMVAGSSQRQHLAAGHLMACNKKESVLGRKR